MKLNFLVPLIGFSLGVFITYDFLPVFWISPILLGSGLLVWIIIYLLSKKPLVGIKISYLNSLWILLFFASLGSIDIYVNDYSNSDIDIQNQLLQYTGEIEEIKYSTDGDRYKVKISAIKDSEDKKISFRNLCILLKANGFSGSKGDIISFYGKCHPVKEYYTSHEYAERLRHQGINFYANVKNPNIRKIGERTSISNYFHELRSKLIILLEKSSTKRDTSEFIISLLLGEKSFLSSEVKESLSTAGIAHILALSGLHIAIILSIVLICLFPLCFWGKNRYRLILAVLFIWFYVILSGAAPSTLRSAIMATFAIGAIIFERKNTAMNSLLAAVFFILIINPFFLWDVGLQLSFLCVATILLFSNKLNPVNQHRHPKLYKTISALLIILITTFCTWSLSTYHFGYLPLLFIPSNFLLLPFLPAFMSVGIIYLLFLCIGIDIHFLASALDIFIDFFMRAINFLSLNGKSKVYLNLSLVSTICWIISLIFITFRIYSSSKSIRRLSGTMSVVCIIFSIGLIIGYKPLIQNSIKFEYNTSSIKTHLIYNNNLHSLEYPRNNIATFDLENYRFLSIDCPIHPHALDSLITLMSGKSHYLIVGPTADSHQISDLINHAYFTKIILHASFSKEKKENLLELIDEGKWDKVYSLRDFGSVEFDL